MEKKMEGIAPAAGSSKATALSFLSPTPGSAVSALLDALQSAPLQNAVLILNLVAFALACCFCLYKMFSRIARAGETGELDESKNQLADTLRMLIATILLTPAPTWSIGQKTIFKIAVSGSGLADRVAIAAGPARDALRITLAGGQPTVSPDATLAISPDGARIVAAIINARWCQRMLYSAFASTAAPLPVPTKTEKLDGTTILNFGLDGVSNAPELVPDVCGSISLPLSADARSAASGIFATTASFFQNISTVSRTILNAHISAIQIASTDAASLVASFPLQPRDTHLMDERVTAWRANFRVAARNMAAQYDAMVLAAGGGSKTQAARQPAETGGLDTNWGWARYGLSFHDRASRVGDTAVALSWTPQFTQSKFPPATPTAYLKLAGMVPDDLRAAGLLPSTTSEASPTSTSGSSTSFDVWSFFGIDKISRAIAIFSDPSADAFEAAALVGPVLTQVGSAAIAAYSAVSFAVPGAGMFVSLVAGTLLALGHTLSLVMPLAPLIGWLFLVLGWLSSILILVVSLSTTCFSLIRDDHSSIFSDSVANLLARALMIALTPALLVLGVTLITPIMQIAWLILSSTIMPAARIAAGGSALGTVFGGVIAGLFVCATLISVVYFSVSRISGLVSAAQESLAMRMSTAGTGERVTGTEHVSVGGSLAPRGGTTGSAQPSGASTPAQTSAPSNRPLGVVPISVTAPKN